MERITANSMGGRPSPVDRDPARRPGVPMLPQHVEAYKDVAGKPINQQAPGDEVLMGVEARINVGADVTPVFGDTVPPKGLSGVILGKPHHQASVSHGGGVGRAGDCVAATRALVVCRCGCGRCKGRTCDFHRVKVALCH